MINVEGLSKRYGNVVAVDDLSFELTPGIVTGFLGPNGAGKSTTMRMILGLDRPSSGRATIGGKQLSEFDWPLRHVGALLDAKAFTPSLPIRTNLRILAATNRMSSARVDVVLDYVGLGDVAHRKTRTCSLGMAQRMGLAGALLGDPEVVILDEPVNGLDPDGVLWIRQLMRSLADEGRTVFLSSHLMSEMEQTADHLVIIGRGRLLADAPLRDFMQSQSGNHVTVRTHAAADLAHLLVQHGGTVATPEASHLEVEGLTAEEIGKIAAADQVALIELRDERTTLEQAYMRLTRDETEYATADKRLVGSHP